MCGIVYVTTSNVIAHFAMRNETRERAYQYRGRRCLFPRHQQQNPFICNFIIKFKMYKYEYVYVLLFRV